MGRIATVLSFLRKTISGSSFSEIEADPGGGPSVTCEHFSSAGDDSHPLKDDYAITISVGDLREGGQIVVGYIDPKNLQKAQKGEKRLYSRSEAGEQACELWLKNDGTTVLENEKGSLKLNADGSQKIENENGSFELKADGTVEINGVIIDVDGNVTVPGDSMIQGMETVVGQLNANTSVTTPLLTAGGIATSAAGGGSGDVVISGSLEAASVKAGAIDLASHTHAGVTSGGESTGPAQ